MSERIEFKTSYRELEALKNQIASEMQFDGSHVIGLRIDNVQRVLNAKDEQAQQLFELFEYIDEEIRRISEKLEQDPEISDEGPQYVKRR